MASDCLGVAKMPSVSCPRCGNYCHVQRDLIGRSVRCPNCNEKFLAEATTFSPSLTDSTAFAPPSPLWVGLTLLCLALALASPAVWAVTVVRQGNILESLQGAPGRDLARYLLYGSAVLAALGGLRLVVWYCREETAESDAGAAASEKLGE
jgi:hypothetical protein